LQLAQHTRTLTSDALMYLREEEFLSHPEPFVEAAQLLGAHASQLFKEVPSGVMTHRWSELKQMIKRHGPSTVGLFARFGRSAFDVSHQEHERIDDVVTRVPDTAGRIFSGMPMLLWSPHVEYFGEGAEGMYRLTAEGGSIPEETYQQLKTKLNILHPYRYLGRRGDLWLLEENLRNLDPEYGPERTVVFYGIARHDWNDAFRGSVVQNLCEVAQRSRLIFAECETYDDFLVYAIRAATLFGFDEQHRLVRPLHGCFIAAHSDPTTSQLGRSSPVLESFYQAGETFPVNTEISPAHGEFFAELACYIEPGGYFGIMGCSSGARRGGHDSLVDYAKREMEHVHVVGPMATISSSADESSHRLIMREDGRIAEIRLREQQVKLLQLGVHMR
jgi:hypothetical protein